MSQINRLPDFGKLNCDEAIEFRFNGKTYSGYRGDTLASALLANGVQLVARSFKFHRPRGIMTAGAEEPNALVDIGNGAAREVNQKATQVELYEGLQGQSVNCWPSVEYDISALFGLFSRFLPAGFYYKTFKWPVSWWKLYEYFIRKSAGFGRASKLADPDYYDQVNTHCDVLIVGAGPAGLAAALSAAESGARVIVADEQPRLGGHLLHRQASIDGISAFSWVQRAVGELTPMSNVRLLIRSTVFGHYDHNFLGIIERLSDHLPEYQRNGPKQRKWRVRARQIIFATGAIERPLVFSNNDRPGIMLCSAVSRYLNLYSVAVGRSIVVFCNNNRAYETVRDCQQARISVAALVDSRPAPPAELLEELKQAGITVYTNSVVADVEGINRIRAVRVRHIEGQHSIRISCDCLAVSGGFNPAVHLHSHPGGKNEWQHEYACFIPQSTNDRWHSVGECAGIFDLGKILESAAVAGSVAAQHCGFKSRGKPKFKIEGSTSYAIEPLWQVENPNHKKQFVDLQNDTTSSDIRLAADEGYGTIEHLKRYTLLGFGTDQGKLGNINGMAILADKLGQSVPETGTTTFRPFYTPTGFGAVAGLDVEDFFDPVRKTAIQAWHVSNGATFENVGQWKRPWYYPRRGESMKDAVDRECLATRKSVGILDASTLGKIEVRGQDAGEFLNRIYTNAWKKLKPGRCRYGLMLGEDGMIMDDGVNACLAENHYYLTTTTGGAGHVFSEMERWLQTEWPELDVYLTSVTEQWATIAVAGPNSIDVLRKLAEGIEFEGASFPFMSFREGRVAGVEARIFRISFSGELCYEINVPADFGMAVWEAVLEAGKNWNITPYGTETMHVLRAEKGFIIVGQDTDGSMTPGDMGLNNLVSRSKDFIGKRSLTREDCLRDDRKQLCGLLTEKPDSIIPEGAQIVENPQMAVPIPMIGHVTSSYYSAKLGHSIALAVIKGGRQRHGETVFLPQTDGGLLRAKICSPVFYDPKGERQHV